MFSRRHLPFQIFTLAFVAAMFFPRVLPEGMFPDGLTYASIARNMAEGRGGFWSPYFSSSFWIPFQGNEYQFYGHPTLAIGALSLFYSVFGDHWFVEKFFSILVWAISIWLFMRLWMVNAREKSLWWLPMFVWYLMPIVLWSYPYFILDNSMAMFSMAAAIMILRGVKKTDTSDSSFIVRYATFIIAGLLLHLAFLTKGPVGLFPLAIPLLYSRHYSKINPYRSAILQTILLSAVCFGTLALWFFYEPARFFWTKYIDVQLISSIADNDQTEQYSWKEYLDLPKNLLLQLLPMLGVSLIIVAFSKIKKVRFGFIDDSHRLAAVYFVIGLSGSLPMMISHKTSAHYLIPCLPFWAIGFGVWHEDTFISWFNKLRISPQKTRKANLIMLFIAICVAIYSFLQIGKVAREREIIHDMAILRGVIPDGAKVCVCDSMMKHFNYHAYFQRYHRWELAKLSDTIPQFFVASKGFCKSTEQDSVDLIFKKINIANTNVFQVYKRQ